jgi:5-hydroxyisourate hydrolase-like protein (transthyretin family)
MKVYDLYIDLIKNPFAIRPYRKLSEYYESIGKHDESLVFLHVISVKFGSEDDTDNQHPDPK